MPKRKIEVVVISDVHLGTYGCHAKELDNYLKSIDPRILVLNGDIIDIWQFSKRYWPESHMKIIQRIFKMMSRGTKIYYIPGNHDEMVRRFDGNSFGRLKITNKLLLKIDGRKTWIFHGDVFDVTMKHSKWLAKLGAQGYDMLILINRFVNYCLQKMGRGKISLSKKIKDSVKSAVKFINNFEETVIDIALENKYDYVICGHIHQPVIREYQGKKGKVTYMNSGDWIENLTSLEYNDSKWSIYRHDTDEIILTEEESDEKDVEIPLSEMLFATFMSNQGIRKPASH